MKYHSFRQRAVSILLMLLCLSLAACSSVQDDIKPSVSPKQDDVQPSDSSVQLSDQASDSSVQGGDLSSDKPYPTKKRPIITFSPSAQLAIDTLWVYHAQEAFAAAILLEREADDSSSLSDLLNEQNPDFSDRWPFISEITAEHTIGDHGELYCIVPLDTTLTFKVRRVTWDTEGNGSNANIGDTVYYSSAKQPFLMYVTHGDQPAEKDLCVEITDKDGSVWTWIPLCGEGVLYNNPLDENGNLRILDFTRLDFTKSDFIDLSEAEGSPFAPNADWAAPTELGLADTVWSSDNGWAMWLSYDESTSQCSGGMVIYEPMENEDGTFLSRYCHGTW